MSQENVEAVRALLDAFAERDLDAAADLLHPDVEIRPALVGGLEGVVYRGSTGNLQFWADIDATWSEFRIVPEQFRDLGGRVLVLGRAFARGRESDVAIDQAAAWIVDLREGQIARFQSFSNTREALEAAGLRE